MAYPILLVMAFSSVFLISVSVAIPAAESRKVRRSIKQLSIYEQKPKSGEPELAQPMVDRLITPYIERVKVWTRKHSPTGAADVIREKLAMAGSPRALDSDSFMSLKLAGVVIGVLLSAAVWLFANLGFGRSLLVSAGLAISGFYLPDLWLHLKIRERQKKIRLVLADTLDLLSISVEAGLGFDGALSKAVQNIPGPLSEEFFRALQEMQMGISRKDALKNLNSRTKVEELQSFLMAIVQAEVFGTSVSQILKVQAKEMRTRRLQKAEEIAGKAPVKMIFPLILCVFPALFVIIVGPAAIRIVDVLFSAL